MTKNNLCLTSLIAAIPGAALAILMVLTFINYAGGSTVVFKTLAAVMLLIGGTLAVMPVGIFVLSGPRGEKASKKKEPGTTDAVGAAADNAEATAVADADELVTADEAAETLEDSGEAGSEEFVTGELDETTAEAGSDDFDLGDDFEFDDAEPKKGK